MLTEEEARKRHCPRHKPVSMSAEPPQECRCIASKCMALPEDHKDRMLSAMETALATIEPELEALREALEKIARQDNTDPMLFKHDLIQWARAALNKEGE